VTALIADRQILSRRWLSSHWLLIALLAVCITRLWLMPLSSSFWTDETETAFIVQHPADPSLAIVRPLTATWYYMFPRAAGSLLGFSELSYRLPSVLMMGIALFTIGRLAARLIDPGAAWFAVFACLAMSDFNYYAADARPYALGICVSAAAVYFLLRWLDTASWKQAFLFVLFAALLWRIHLVFWAFYPVFVIATLVHLLCSRTTGPSTRVGWLRALLVYLAVALTLMPVALQALAALRDAHIHAYFPFPRFRFLPGALMWKWIAPCVGLVWLSGLFLKWRFQRPASPGAVALIAAWWLWMPLCLFAFSRTIGPILFVPRYYSLALPGAALAATAAAAFWLPRTRWKQASIALAVVGLIATGQWNTLWPDHTHEDWRRASLNEDLAAAEHDTPVIAVSPFIEAMPPVWSPDYRLPGYLYSPLFVYPIRGKVYPFPFMRSPEAERYADGLLAATLLARARFIVYGAGLNTVGWVQWFSERPELARWRYTSASAGEVGLAVFENPSR
jgi:Dolichyl-phosphate-mannose-protein mannosyltransferase